MSGDYFIKARSMGTKHKGLIMPALSSAIKVVPQTVASPGTTIFTVKNGPIIINHLVVEITTAIDATACTMQFATTDTVSGTTQTISNASGDTQGKAAGISISLDPVALNTAPVISAAGGSSLANPAAGNAALGGILMLPGTCGLITIGSPAGNIRYHLDFTPVDGNSTVIMA